MKMKASIAAAALALCSLAHAQDYPTKAIRIIVPLTPGSGADIAGRIIAARMSEHWKQPVLVENRPGAGGNLAADAVAKSAPDGYTLLVSFTSHTINAGAMRPSTSASPPKRRRACTSRRPVPGSSSRRRSSSTAWGWPR